MNRIQWLKQSVGKVRQWLRQEKKTPPKQQASTRQRQQVSQPPKQEKQEPKTENKIDQLSAEEKANLQQKIHNATNQQNDNSSNDQHERAIWHNRPLPFENVKESKPPSRSLPVRPKQKDNDREL